jgi:hypothetical protein
LKIQLNPTPKIQKSWMFNPRSMSKNQKSWIFVGLLDWIGFFQFNPTNKTPKTFNKNPTKIQLFSNVQSSIQFKIQKKVDFLILTSTKIYKLTKKNEKCQKHEFNLRL